MVGGSFIHNQIKVQNTMNVQDLNNAQLKTVSKCVHLYCELVLLQRQIKLVLTFVRSFEIKYKTHTAKKDYFGSYQNFRC